MRRYTALLCTAFLLLIVVIAGSVYLAGRGRGDDGAALQELTVYTTLPAEHVATLGTVYEREHRVRLNFVPLAASDIIARLKEQAEGDRRASLVLADRETLERAAAMGYLVPYLSETGDQVPESLRQRDGYWVGVWYDPIVFCVNRDYLKTLAVIPDNWTALANTKRVRIGVTDFMAADAAANLMYSMIAQYGDVAAYNIWARIHPNVVQYARYLSNPVRQAGMGEVDIAIAVESESIRYLQDGYPLKIIYPADGTAAMVTGTALAFNGPDSEREAAKALADWLLGDEAQQTLQAAGFYFVPTNPGTLAYKSFAGKNIVLFNQPVSFTPEQKHSMLDRWAKEIRFK